MGSWTELVWPSPKFQAQKVGVPVEVSVKATVWPVTPLVKWATREDVDALTVTLWVTGLLVPTALLAVSVAV